MSKSSRTYDSPATAGIAMIGENARRNSSSATSLSWNSQLQAVPASGAVVGSHGSSGAAGPPFDSVQPAGRAGGTTPSKFSLRIVVIVPGVPVSTMIGIWVVPWAEVSESRKSISPPGGNAGLKVNVNGVPEGAVAPAAMLGQAATAVSIVTLAVEVESVPVMPVMVVAPETALVT